jgi:glycosyltransferase involved in cell wall biosynthesis
MKLELIYLGIVSLFEAFLWVRPVWLYRKYIACAIIVVLSIASGLFFGSHLNVWVAMIVVFSIYRMINLLRIVEGRTNADYLYHVARKTSFALISLQIISLAVYLLTRHHHIKLNVWLYVALVIQAGFALMLIASTLRHIKKSRPSDIETNYASRDLPTLSVLIPARNETDELDECLKSLLNSTYSKLEILVLDDCSQDRKTSEIIRGFAHEGVTFMGGEVPPDDWLAKNYAYEQLSKQANGDILLFCGVDTRFEEETLRLLVEELLNRKKTMLSIMPNNKLSSGFSLKKSLIQPTRYAWEVALPRRLLNRPPVLSTCWLIKASTLKDCGGFESVKRTVSIESNFAKYAASKNDGYSFMRSGNLLGLSSVKTFAEQRDTAIRTRYPQTHRRPEIVGLLSIAEFTAFLGPITVFVISLVNKDWLALILSVIVFGMYKMFYLLILRLTYGRFILFEIALTPIAALYDIALLNYSMWQYEFNEVLWKGRNVCLPVMRVEPPDTLKKLI